MAVPFPRQQARTRRFSLGAPRSFTISPDGERVVFLRSPAGDDPANSLWVYEVATGEEREVASAASHPRRCQRGGCPPRSGRAGNAAGSSPGA